MPENNITNVLDELSAIYKAAQSLYRLDLISEDPFEYVKKYILSNSDVSKVVSEQFPVKKISMFRED